MAESTARPVRNFGNYSDPADWPAGKLQMFKRAAHSIPPMQENEKRMRVCCGARRTDLLAHLSNEPNNITQ